MQQSVFFDKRRKQWRGYVTLDDGRRKYASGETRSDVRRTVNKIISDAESGNYIEPSNMTVNGLLDNWMAIRKTMVSPLTYQLDEQYKRSYLIPYFGNDRIQSIDTLKITRLYSELTDRGLAYGTVKRLHNYLNKFFKDMTRPPFQLIKVNPCAFATIPTKNKKTFNPAILTVEEYNKLLEEAKGTIHYMPSLLAGTLGLRKGEVFGLRWRDIDFNKKTVHVCQSAYFDRALKKTLFKEPKSESSNRIIVAPDRLIEILSEHKRNRPENQYDLIITNNRNAPVNIETYYRQFYVFVRKHNIKNCRFHDLRHFNATVMLLKGINVNTASKRLGHASPAITMNVYQHVLDSMDKDAADKINSIIPDL